ncbi:hypothetical protein SAMN05444000_11947 [Shimia gijangensis]|uniref:Uncharacterized protein n=1 Tax=Shimia gijangensis TaxID=1470563 RepID=A0A1M6PU21_9RHOB|nr:hypothetical protein SAMN05444000_11947 [Shimia gijangensis]
MKKCRTRQQEKYALCVLFLHEKWAVQYATAQFDREEVCLFEPFDPI